MEKGVPYLLILVSFYGLGVLGGVYFFLPSLYPLYLLFFFLPLLFYGKKKNLRLFFIILSLQFFLAGLFLTGLRFQSYLGSSSLFQIQREEVHLVGIISSIPQETSQGFRFLVRPKVMKEGDEIRPISWGLLQVFSKGGKFYYGDLLEIKGQMMRPSGMKNPGGFSYRNYLYQQGIAGNFFKREGDLLLKVDEGRKGLFYLAQLIKDWIGRRLTMGFPPPYDSLMRALLLGERELLPPHLSQLFKETGLGHLLAVSGLHVGIISLFFWRFFLFLKIKEKHAALLMIPLMIFYMVICGLQASIVRASLVVIFYSLARLLEQEVNILDLMGLSALILLLYNPFFLLQVGFQLSYLVYLSILTMTPLLKPLTKALPEKLGLSLNLSLAAQLGAWPVMAYYFHQFSLWPLLANLVAIPLLSIILTFIVPALFISFFSFFLYGILAFIIRILLQILLFLLEFFSLVPVMVINTGGMQIPFLCLYFLLLSLFIFILLKKRGDHSFSRGEKVLLVMLILLVLFNLYFLMGEGNEGILKAYFLDVGSGLAIFFSLPGGETLFYDGGGIFNYYRPDYNQVAEEIINPFLSYKGLKRVDALIISHYHVDHVLGFLPLIQENRTSFIAGPWRGEDLLHNELYYQVKEMAHYQKISFFFLEEGDLFTFGEVLFRVLAPPPGLLLNTGSDENNNSLLIRVEYGDITLLLTGDMEKEMEASVLKDKRLLPYLPAHLLQVGHHGSNTSSTTPFLKAVTPKISIISSSPTHFDHPSPLVLERLSLIGSKIYRTDLFGAIVVETDGNTLSVYPYGRDLSHFRLIALGGSY